MLFKKLSLLAYLFLIQTLAAGDFAENDPQKKNFLIRKLTHKGNEALKLEFKDFYGQLKDSVNTYFLSHDKSSLKKIPIRPTIVRMILKMLKRLNNFQLRDNDKTIVIQFEDLGLFEYDLFQFINYLLFIVKITDTLQIEYPLKDHLSLFSDNVFSNPLLIFLLIDCLRFAGYKSITLSILSDKKTNYQRLPSSISELEDLKFQINQYLTASDFLNTHTKIDMYLSNLSFPRDQNYFRCVCKKQLSPTKSELYHLFVLHSKTTNSSLGIATELLSQEYNINRDYVFNELMNQLTNPTQELTNKVINQYSCNLYPSAETTLADIIYVTNNADAEAKVPIFVYHYSAKDTGAGIVAENIIIEAYLSNPHSYKELLCSLLKTNIALAKVDFEHHASKLQAFSHGVQDGSFPIFKETLSKVNCIVLPFLRDTKLLAPSIIEVP